MPLSLKERNGCQTETLGRISAVKKKKEPETLGEEVLHPGVELNGAI